MSNVYRRGGSVHGEKSYGCRPCRPCKPCTPEKIEKKDLCCQPCNDPCDPCFRPYVVKCNGPDGCHTYDLCVKPDDCLMKDLECRKLFCELKKSIIFHRLDLLHRDLTEQTYDNLVMVARSIASRVDGGRLVLTLPDGTVVVDTFFDDTVNTWANFQAKSINENHNSRVAIFSAQAFTQGVGSEQKLSTTTGNVEKGVAIRLGEFLKNFGTARLSAGVAN